MKTSKIIGKKVLDCEANDVGKVSDIDIDIKSNVINKVIVNTGELSLRKVNFEVTPDMIAQVGDYVLLKVSNSDLSSKHDEEKSDVEIVDPSKLEEK